ncbi:MAG: AAA family ATPase [Spirochaetales bacterium]|jgi:putative ATPase|nr:AAA family ATPase [Spirochaetales bacterium]
MDLFSAAGFDGLEGRQPLAFRMRPRTLEEYVGQEEILGPGRLLRRIIAADQLSSLIFYGPPGTGKTTLAQVIANSTKSRFVSLNAVLAGVAALREVLDQAKETRDLHGRRTTLFVDEVHRWNKAQQDALLPWVENGTLILIGATTENPFFEVNPALVSRSRLFQLKALNRGELKTILTRTLQDPLRGYGRFRVEIDEAAADHLVETASGDARTLLNALELAVETTPPSFPPPPETEIHITLSIAEESIQQKALLYDKNGDYHYDTISAFIKSLRGSDPDAALYWLARMIKAGESPRFLFRRMLILACEDVGLADPQALPVVEAAAAAFDRVGLPEGQYQLTLAVLYLATAPKSNSAIGYFDAVKQVEGEYALEVPNHLRDSSRDKEGFGHGEGYLYPHAFRDHWTAQQYLPRELQGRIFYQPSDQGFEKTLAPEVARRRELQLETALAPPSVEVLNFTPPSLSPLAGESGPGWARRSGAEISDQLKAQREALLEGLAFRRNDRILVPFSGAGLLVWEALRQAPEGGVYVFLSRKEEGELLESLGEKLLSVENPQAVWDLDEPALPPFEKILVHRFLFRRRPSLSSPPAGKDTPASPPPSPADLLGRFYRLLAPGGLLSAGEIIPRLSPRLSSFLEEEANPAWREALLRAEEALYENPSLPSGWTEAGFAAALEQAGFTVAGRRVLLQRETLRISPALLEFWLSPAPAPSAPPGYGSLLAGLLDPEEIRGLTEKLTRRLCGAPVPWERSFLVIRGVKPVSGPPRS